MVLFRGLVAEQLVYSSNDLRVERGGGGAEAIVEPDWLTGERGQCRMNCNQIDQPVMSRNAICDVNGQPVETATINIRGRVAGFSGSGRLSQCKCLDGGTKTPTGSGRRRI